MERFESKGVIGLMAALYEYADALEPWARKIASKMVVEVANRDRDAWRALGNEISTQLHTELREAPIGQRVQQLINEQVILITSIPRQAAERAQALSLEAVASGGRAREVALQIQRTTEVTRSRALLIARTETSRAATVLLQARSEAVGATHYIWRTAMDSDVRPGHKDMEGKVCEWANPPLVMEGDPPNRPMHFHPGSVWNCRCYAESIIDDPYKPTVKGRRRH